MPATSPTAAITLIAFIVLSHLPTLSMRLLEIMCAIRTPSNSKGVSDRGRRGWRLRVRHLVPEHDLAAPDAEYRRRAVAGPIAGARRPVAEEEGRGDHGAARREGDDLARAGEAGVPDDGVGVRAESQHDRPLD